MKSKYIKYAVAALLVTGCCAVKADGLLDSKRVEIKTALAGATLSETVKTSISLISAASDKDRAAVTVAVVQTVAAAHFSFVPSLISVIGHKVPSMVAIAAREAVRINPEQAAAIAKAAVEASSSQAVAIVRSIISVVPSRYQSVGDAAIEAAPAQARDILNAIAQNIPSLSTYINTALAGNSSVSASNAENILRHAAAIAIVSSQNLDGVQVAQDNSSADSSGKQATSPQYLPAPASKSTPPAPLPPGGIVLDPTQTHQAPTGPQTYSPP